jgi:hypothetical protein
MPNDYGTDRFEYRGDRKVLVAQTRTFRPFAGESCAAFRRRVDTVAARFLPNAVVEVAEEFRAGALTQATLHIRFTDPPQPAAPAAPAVIAFPSRRVQRKAA